MSDTKEFYLQFGDAQNLPMQTVHVEHKHAPLWFHERGLMQTSTGYGSKLKTEYMIKYNNRWRRVYCACFSNVGTCYVLIDGEKIIITEYQAA
jgi:hypothetical protein